MRTIQTSDLKVFAIDGQDHGFVGVSFQRWNGWECPLFFADQLTDILRSHTDLQESEKNTAVEFFSDAFDFHQVMCNGFPRLMVSVGSHYWCWEECEWSTYKRNLNMYTNWLNACDSLSLVTGEC